ncbi:hypothetical protein LUX32_11450 [Actinomadura madurae]|nr:hypothetical protein [Actinomadura madurae]
MTGLAAEDPALLEPVVPGLPVTGAELAWAVLHEGALDADDLLDRRTRIGLVASDREAALPGGGGARVPGGTSLRPPSPLGSHLSWFGRGLLGYPYLIASKINGGTRGDEHQGLRALPGEPHGRAAVPGDRHREGRAPGCSSSIPAPGPSTSRTSPARPRSPRSCGPRRRRASGRS